MSKAAIEILRGDLDQLNSRLEDLRVQKHQFTREATQRIQAIDSEIQAVEQRIGQIKEIVEPAK